MILELPIFSFLRVSASLDVDKTPGRHLATDHVRVIQPDGSSRYVQTSDFITESAGASILCGSIFLGWSHSHLLRGPVGRRLCLPSR